MGDINELNRERSCGLKPVSGVDAAVLNLEFYHGLMKKEAAKIEQLLLKAQRAVDSGNAAEIENISDQLDKSQAAEQEYKTKFQEFCVQYGLVK